MLDSPDLENRPELSRFSTSLYVKDFKNNEISAISMFNGKSNEGCVGCKTSTYTSLVGSLLM